MLFVAAVVVILAAAAIPISMRAIERSRAWAATRYLAGKAADARLQAVRRSRYVALRFEGTENGVSFSLAMDANRNGVRTLEIESRVDPLLEPPVLLSQLFPGVVIGVDEKGGFDGVQFGASGMLSFAPRGTASSGTVYVRGKDGSRFALRVLGATGRTRVLQYRPGARDWVESF